MKKIFLSIFLCMLTLNANEIYATFNVKAQRSANLAFVASGIVNRVNVSIGSKVKKGDILASLQNSDLKAILDKSKTTLKYAKKDFNRQIKIKKLIDAGKFDVVSKNLENAKNSEIYQQVLYNKTFLKAPFNAVIYAKNIEIGDAVSKMTLKTVFKIQSIYNRKLILKFDQKYHNIVKVGDKFRYKIDGDSKLYNGIISKIYPQADMVDRKMRAEVKAKNFTVGLFGDGYIIIKDK